MTAHKAPGMTLEAAQIDLGRGAFAHGQTYVALSRVRTLRQLWLRRPLRPANIIVDKAVTDSFAVAASKPAPESL